MLLSWPIVIAGVYALAMVYFSAWRVRADLNNRSSDLVDARLKPLLESMAQVLSVSALPVRVYNVPVINGLATLDGRIFITRGLLDAYHLGRVTDQELAAVIAHEIGHLALGHTRRRIIDFSMQNVIRVMLMTILGRFIPWVGVWIANGLTVLLAARLSRQDEFEADRYAAVLLIKTGLGTRPLKSLFRKLDDLSRGGNDSGATTGMPAWFLTHPPAQQRIAAIEAAEQEWYGSG